MEKSKGKEATRKKKVARGGRRNKGRNKKRGEEVRDEGERWRNVGRRKERK